MKKKMDMHYDHYFSPLIPIRSDRSRRSVGAEEQRSRRWRRSGCVRMRRARDGHWAGLELRTFLYMPSSPPFVRSGFRPVCDLDGCARSSSVANFGVRC
jgi:hypothetical protein